MLHDPIEDDPALAPLIAKAEAEAEAEIGDSRGSPRQLGYCHVLWATKQRILRERYGIQWRTPAEMNPYILFD